MIDPQNIINYNRSLDELYEFWLFCLFVRGKNADTQAKKLEAYLYATQALTDDPVVLPARDIEKCLRAVRAGQYISLTKAISETNQMIWSDPNFLRNSPLELFEMLSGVGPKTARYFIMSTREGTRHAALDTHLLRFLRMELGDWVPKSTPPSGGLYNRLEKEFLTLVDKEGMTPSEMDLAIWRASRVNQLERWREYV